MTDMNVRSAATLIALIVSLAGLLAAFLLSLNAASRHFERAAAAQAQLAAVSRIEALAAVGYPKAQLATALNDYRASIARETNLLGSPTARAAQRLEAVDADRLATLALAPGNRLGLAALVSRIADRERNEAGNVAAAMGRLRVRTTILALLLSAAALGAALSGVLALQRANHRLARDVAAKTADLRAVDQSRRLFFAKASHELRTPITVMRGEAEVSLADAGAGVGELRESLSHIVANADFLGRRVEELLSLSKADDGLPALVLASVDLVGLVADTAQVARRYARSAEVAIDVVLPESAVPITADVRWLGQALLAVIDNGVKFSPQGGTLRLMLDVETGKAVIRVSDDGAGVMEAALPRIFDAYYQTEAGRMRGGTGLGLALARWVAEQHGGAIAAANAPQGGCRITITLPMEQAT